MTSEELLRVLGDVDSRKIQDALDYEPIKRKTDYSKIKKWSALFVASVTILIIGFGVYHNQNRNLSVSDLYIEESPASVTSGTDSGTEAETEGEGETETESENLLSNYAIYDIYQKADFQKELQSQIPMKEDKLPVLQDSKIEATNKYDLSNLPWSHYEEYSIGSYKSLSLELAKNYLEEGYVLVSDLPLNSEFSKQVSEDFLEYSGVVIIYVYNEKTGYDIPTYRFYKKLQDNYYAVVSIPAIEIEGYSSIFEK